jgi:hypothetical protein
VLERASSTSTAWLDTVASRLGEPQPDSDAVTLSRSSGEDAVFVKFCGHAVHAECCTARVRQVGHRDMPLRRSC